jgi:hypothetical protein
MTSLLTEARREGDGESPFTRGSLDERCIEAGFLAPGSSLRLPPSPASAEWQLPWERDVGGGLAGYSGGTAQVFDLLPFYPLVVRGTSRMPQSRGRLRSLSTTASGGVPSASRRARR